MSSNYTIARVQQPGTLDEYEEFVKDEIEQSISHCFEKRVGKFTDRHAIKSRNGVIIYSALYHYANRFALPLLEVNIGEVLIRSPYLIPGYWRDTQLTIAILLPDPKDEEQQIFYSGDLKIPKQLLFEASTIASMAQIVNQQQYEMVGDEQILDEIDTHTDEEAQQLLGR